MHANIKKHIIAHGGNWEKLLYESGFINYGKKVYGGWEHTYPVNPKMNDKVIKRIKITI